MGFTLGHLQPLAAGIATLALATSSAQPSARAQEVGDSDLRPVVALETVSMQGAHLVADLEGGGLAQLTLDPVLQESVTEALAAHRLPYSAAAVVSIPDGRVKVLAGYSKNDPSLDTTALALRPWAPAASVFKVVTAAALVEESHLSPETQVCYHGGISAVLRDNLIDLPSVDRTCANLGYGIGKSQNAIIAKLAARHLRPEQLQRMADSFGFGQEIAFDIPVEPSEAEIPQEPLEFARTAAGFWHTSLSALHGALLAATVANRGVMPAPRLVEKAVDAHGAPIGLPRSISRRVLSPETADQVGRMMQLTTSMGTARRSFRDRRGHAFLPIEVAGKTGTLFSRGLANDPPLPSGPGAVVLPEGGQVGYSWFVGYAPADHPQIAFAVLLGNPASSHVRAHVVARQLLASYLAKDNFKNISGRIRHLIARR